MQRFNEVTKFAAYLSIVKLYGRDEQEFKTYKSKLFGFDNYKQDNELFNCGYGSVRTWQNK